ncbi:MAG: hypothetical protein ABIH24_07110 [Verrucomicrobiota bacterium]
MPTQVELHAAGPAHDAPEHSVRLAIFISAAVCPGAGHFVQRRWILGALYLTVFVACLVMMLLTLVVPLMANLRITLDVAEKGGNATLRTISLIKVLIWFGLAVLIYLAALADIIVYARGQARRRQDERRKNLLPL